MILQPYINIQLDDDNVAANYGCISLFASHRYLTGWIFCSRDDGGITLNYCQNVVETGITRDDGGKLSEELLIGFINFLLTLIQAQLQ